MRSLGCVCSINATEKRTKSRILRTKSRIRRREANCPPDYSPRFANLPCPSVQSHPRALTASQVVSTFKAPMITFDKLSVDQLKRAVEIRENIEALQEQLNKVLGGEIPVSLTAAGPRRRKVSAAGRTRMAAAQRARWANVGGANVEAATEKTKRKMSAAGRAAISAAAKARWRKAKAAGKTRL